MLPTCATVPETITVGQPTHHLISKSWAENFGSAPHKFPQECRNFDTFQLYMHTTVSVLDPHQKRWETDRIILYFPQKKEPFFQFPVWEAEDFSIFQDLVDVLTSE